jgi:hypothetical protein
MTGAKDNSAKLTAYFFKLFLFLDFRFIGSLALIAGAPGRLREPFQELRSDNSPSYGCRATRE